MKRLLFLLVVFFIPVIIYPQGNKKATISQQVDEWYNTATDHLSKLKIDSGLFYAQKIKTIADSAGYKAGLGKYYLVKGSALFFRGKGDEASQNLQQAITVFKQYNNQLFLGIAYQQLARVAANENDYTYAQQLYRQAIPLITASGDTGRLQWAVYYCGRNFFFALELDSAVHYLSRALQLAEQLKNNTRVFAAASMLGSAYSRAENYIGAEKTLSYALSIQPSASDKVELLETMAEYANVLIIREKNKEAGKAIQELDKLFASSNDTWGRITALKLKGSLLYNEGRYQQALPYLKEAYDLDIDGHLDENDKRNVTLILGKTELKTGDVQRAIAHFRLAKKLATGSNQTGGVLDASLLLAEAFQQNNQMDSAYHYFRQYSHVKDSVFTFRKERAILELSAKYDAEKREQQIKNLQTEKQLQSTLAAKQQQQKNLVIIIALVVLLSGAYVFYRYLENKKLSNQLAQSLTDLKIAQQQIIQTEKEKESENIRGSISRDIHDEVGATLSGVALFSEIAKEKMQQQQQQEVMTYLDHISSNSKDMVEKISDIVWAINPDNDSFERITEKLKAYTLNLCAGKGIRLNFQVDEAINNAVPVMEARRNIYLFSKEAINNAVKYSGCTEILFSLKQNNGHCLLEIKDNGKGFNSELVIKGNGLKNMQARANGLKADYTLSGHPGQGTAIKLRFDFHPNGGQEV